MSGARLRFGLALALFLGWLGWLGYLVARQSREQPVSRPQILAAEYLIVGRVEAGPDGAPSVLVKVEQVYASPAGGGVPDKITTDLSDALGFRGSGSYLLPLSPEKGQPVFRVTPIPRSPGYDPRLPQSRPYVYRWGPDVEAQLREVRPP
jgi:hypothetical protein